ncbi:hypothetical protein FBUS_03869 [Fasciolopsis buskii]|uniref:Uncharacterized protein n=1 Tax=Fasciolopsis buskii TaxID=27845 RepID=A0A8E0VI44_9TREM|nr:hypothetical protein FBUS_03869 [Fasciolopsis buski]
MFGRKFIAESGRSSDETVPNNAFPQQYSTRKRIPNGMSDDNSFEELAVSRRNRRESRVPTLMSSGSVLDISLVSSRCDNCMPTKQLSSSRPHLARSSSQPEGPQTAEDPSGLTPIK